MAKRTQPKDDLAEAVESLTKQVIVLRQVIDELFTEVQWRNQNPESRNFDFHRRIESFSVDPSERNFEVNSVPSATISQLRDSLDVPLSAGGPQGRLFG